MRERSVPNLIPQNEVAIDIIEQARPQPPARAPTQEESRKMNMLRGFLVASIAYDLECENKADRIAALGSFIQDIYNTTNQNLPAPDAQNATTIYSIFKGNAATELATFEPNGVLNTKAKAIDYYLEYIPDIIHKSVHGTYPPGRGAEVHGQPDDAPIAPLNRDELNQVYTISGRDINGPLFELNKLEELRRLAARTVNFTEAAKRVGSAARRIFGGYSIAREAQRNAPLLHTVSGLGMIANIGYAYTSGEIESTSRYSQANSYAGAAVIGAYGGMATFVALTYIGQVTRNTATMVGENFFNGEDSARQIQSRTVEVRLGDARDQQNDIENPPTPESHSSRSRSNSSATTNSASSNNAPEGRFTNNLANERRGQEGGMSL